MVSFSMIAPANNASLPVDKRVECMEVLWDWLRKGSPKSPEWHGLVLNEQRAKIESEEAVFISGSELRCRLQA